MASAYNKILSAMIGLSASAMSYAMTPEQIQSYNDLYSSARAGHSEAVSSYQNAMKSMHMKKIDFVDGVKSFDSNMVILPQSTPGSKYDWNPLISKLSKVSPVTIVDTRLSKDDEQTIDDLIQKKIDLGDSRLRAMSDNKIEQYLPLQGLNVKIARVQDDTPQYSPYESDQNAARNIPRNAGFTIILGYHLRDVVTGDIQRKRDLLAEEGIEAKVILPAKIDTSSTNQEPVKTLDVCEPHAFFDGQDLFMPQAEQR